VERFRDRRRHGRRRIRTLDCCAVGDDCTAAQFMDCDRTGFYGAYLRPTAAPVPNGFEATYTLSSFDPYNVVLFRTSFAR
jgi:hypothetical protein